MIFGATGLIGASFLRNLDPKTTTGYSFSKNKKGLIPLDILNFELLKSEVRQKKPDHIFWAVNLSGGVNRCEDDPESAKNFHLNATRVISQLANEVNAKLVFISSDYVFPNSENPVSEEDLPRPLNIYGKLKLEAEKIIEKECPCYLIIRSTNVYGWDKNTTTPNFFMQIYRKLASNETIFIPKALGCTPTYVEDLTLGILKLIETNNKGHFHLVGPDNMSRIEWAGEIAKALDFNETDIQGIDDFSNIPERPIKLELSSNKFLKETNFKRKSLKEALLLIKHRINEDQDV